MKRTATSKSGKKKRILVVEDEPIMLEFLGTMLRAAGYEVEEAEHALAAVFAVVRSATPDLILTDIRMPIIDGVGLVQRIKADPDARHIPVVAVTGLDSAEARATARKAGCIGYITKPIDPKKFPKQVAAFLRPPKPKTQTRARPTQKRRTAK